MVDLTPLEVKVIKQLEYYFGDVNLTRDKFMKETMKENDGWISFETLLKFKRLKELTEDVDYIKNCVSKSHTGLLEVNEKGLRRKPECVVPDSFDVVLQKYKDRSVYVKGFDEKCELDQIIDWLELHGGKTMNVHLRRHPTKKNFKGSVFVIFEEKEFAENLLNSAEASTFQGNEMIRLYQTEYLARRRGLSNKGNSKGKSAENGGETEKHTDSRIMLGALLEITGLPKMEIEKSTTDSKDSETKQDTEEKLTTDSKDSETKESTETKEDHEPTGALTVLNLKQWLTNQIGTNIPVAWVDVEPAVGRAIVRFKQANSASQALEELKKKFSDKPIIYMDCELNGRVLTDKEEQDHWKTVLTALQKKSRKRCGQMNNGGRNHAKRRR